MWTCGSNKEGQLGHALLDASCPVPRRVESMAERHVVCASCAERYTALATALPLPTPAQSAAAAVYLMGMQQGKVLRVSLPLSAGLMQQLSLQGARVEVQVHAQNERTWVVLAGQVLVVEHAAASPQPTSLVHSPSSSSPPLAADRRRGLGSKALFLRCGAGKHIRRMSAPQSKGNPLAVTQEGEVLELVPASPPASKTSSSAAKRATKTTPPCTPSGNPPGTPTYRGSRALPTASPSALQPRAAFSPSPSSGPRVFCSPEEGSNFEVSQHFEVIQVHQTHPTHPSDWLACLAPPVTWGAALASPARASPATSRLCSCRIVFLPVPSWWL